MKAGSTFLSPAGVLAVEAVAVVAESSVRDVDVRRAGFASKDELLEELRSYGRGRIHRIELRRAGDDPRIALRRRTGLDDVEVLARRLARLDAASRRGPWTERVLRLIDANPARRSAELAEKVGRETRRFKTDVRRLKNLGLTESLGTGYRLSPRGRAWLSRGPL